MESITIRLTIQEAELVLSGLGNMPYNQVANLIANIQKQGSDQLATQASAQVGQVQVEEEVKAE